MKPIWIIEKDIFQENIEEMIKSVSDQGMDHKIVSYVPFEAGEYKNLLPENSCAIVYGSLQLARCLQKTTNWIPGVYCDLPKYECSYYYTKLGSFLLNSPYVMLPFGELVRQKEFLFEALGNSDCLFIRPSSGFKLFTGKVVEKENYEREIEKFSFYDVEPEKIVVVATPQNIKAEWRLVVVEGKVIASSQYQLHRKHITKEGCPDVVKQYAEEIAKVWEPDPAWTVDICQLDSNEIRLLEIGCFSCAGLYDCNKSEIVSVVSNLAIKHWKDVNE